MIRKVLILGMWLMAGMALWAGSKTHTLLELRLYEGFRETAPGDNFRVRSLDLDPAAARIREKEEQSIKDIFVLKRIRFRSSLEIWLPELQRGSQEQHVVLHGRRLTLGFEPFSGEADRFRLKVTVEPPDLVSPEILLQTVVILPQNKRAVLGFKDKGGQVYFISLGRGRNVELGHDRMIDGRAVRLPRLLNRVEPEYPLSALEQGISGMVVVEATTDAKGKTTSAVQLTGPAELGSPVLAAVRQWLYHPLNVDGLDEPLRYLVVCHFYIPKEGVAISPLEEIHACFDAFWEKHEKNPWPDPAVKGPVSKGINQRLVEMIIIKGSRENRP